MRVVFITLVVVAICYGVVNERSVLPILFISTELLVGATRLLPSML